MEFVSALENLIPAQELSFEPTPGFGRFSPFLKQATSHPAKMNTHFLEFLIERHTKEGDTVLDPMSGSGSTGVVSALLNRNAVCVELERKFYEWMEEARENVEKVQTITPKGRIRNICGDARRLSELLGRADVAITSPPYGASMNAKNPVSKWSEEAKRRWFATYKKQGGGLNYEGFIKLMEKQVYQYSENTNNIGNLPLGNVDVVIMSPPYTNSAAENPNVIELQKRGYVKGGDLARFVPSNMSEGNLGNLPLGSVDAVITSPPYEATVSDNKEGPLAGANEQKYGRWKKGTAKKHSYSQEGEPSKVDAVITSPPYDGRKIAPPHSQVHLTYPNLSDNIGNLKKETYVSEMLKVYSEMFKVLKPDGTAIVVIKPFIRNKKVVDLPWQTWLILKKVGFSLTALYKLRLGQMSFWRILYYKKHPEVPTLAHEYAIVVKKEV